jgi:hypothetical protein
MVPNTKHQSQIPVDQNKSPTLERQAAEATTTLLFSAIPKRTQSDLVASESPSSPMAHLAFSLWPKKISSSSRSNAIKNTTVYQRPSTPVDIVFFICISEGIFIHRDLESFVDAFS